MNDLEIKIVKIANNMRPAIIQPPYAEWVSKEEFEEQRIDMLRCAILYKNIEESDLDILLKTIKKCKNQIN